MLLAMLLAGCAGSGDAGTTTPTGLTRPETSSPAAEASSRSQVRRSSEPPSANDVPAAPRRSAALASCADVPVGPARARLATRLVASGVTCEQATTLVRAVSARDDVDAGARRFSSGEYRCHVRIEDPDRLTGSYVCTRAGVVVTWTTI